MVSALSMRLMRDCNRAAVSMSNHNQDQSQKMQHDSIASGYNGDKEGDSIGLPPVLIGLHHKRKLSCEEEGSKRRKMSEENYKASTVFQDLKQAGRPVPPLLRLRPRISPFIDISKVTHLSSKSIEGSPFLHSISLDHDILTDYGNMYQDLMRQTRPLYAAFQGGKDTSDSEDTKSTCSASSMSETESDSSISSNTSPAMLVIHGRLDDKFPPEQHPNKDDSQQQAPNVAPFAVPPPRSLSMSLENAIGLSDKARLVASSVAPHRIIFANARFSAMTGLSSCATLGRPLKEILTPPSSSWEVCAAAEQDGGNMETAVLNKDNKNIQCSVKVTTVLSEVNGVWPNATPSKIVTHYAVDLSDPMDEDDDDDDDADNNNNSWDAGAFVYQVIA